MHSNDIEKKRTNDKFTNDKNETQRSATQQMYDNVLEEKDTKLSLGDILQKARRKHHANNI